VICRLRQSLWVRFVHSSTYTGQFIKPGIGALATVSISYTRDGLCANRANFPMTACIVAGTQAAKAHVNNVIIVRMSNLFIHPKKDEDDESYSDGKNMHWSNRTNRSLIVH